MRRPVLTMIAAAGLPRSALRGTRNLSQAFLVAASGKRAKQISQWQCLASLLQLQHWVACEPSEPVSGIGAQKLQEPRMAGSGRTSSRSSRTSRPASGKEQGLPRADLVSFRFKSQSHVCSRLAHNLGSEAVAARRPDGGRKAGGQRIEAREVLVRDGANQILQTILCPISTAFKTLGASISARTKPGLVSTQPKPNGSQN